MDKIFDLPAHPLVVHFPVVAIPVLAIVAIWLAARPAARRRYGIPTVVLGVATTVATFLAASSGSGLKDELNIPDSSIGTHEDLGNTLRFFVLLLLVAVVALVVMGRRQDEDGGVAQVDASGGVSITALGGPVMAGIAAATLLFAALSLIWVVRTGHEGAKSSWGFVYEDAGGTPVVAAGGDSDPTAEPEPAPTETAEAAQPTAVPDEPEPTTAAEPTERDEPVESEDPDPDEAGGESGEAGGEIVLVDSGVGATVYEQSCQRCHSADGSGGRGPSLIGLAQQNPDPAALIQLVNEGRTTMPGFGGTLSEDEIQSVLAYILETF